ncbi:hypothetical protein, partial [Streptomyces klenkii]
MHESAPQNPRQPETETETPGHAQDPGVSRRFLLKSAGAAGAGVGVGAGLGAGPARADAAAAAPAAAAVPRRQ